MTTISLTEKRLMAKLAEIERRPQPRAVLHFDDRGEPSLYADDGVTVYWVDERVPHDRIFRSRPVPIPVGMLDGPIGESDLTDEQLEAARVAAEAIVNPTLYVVGEGDPQDVPAESVRAALEAMERALAEAEARAEDLRGNISKLRAQYGRVL